MTDKISKEFSREVNLELVNKSGSRLKLEATQSEREQLAKRYSIPKIETLVVDCDLKKLGQKGYGDYLLEAKMEAVVVQNCILTLDELKENISEQISIIFKNEDKARTATEEPLEIDFELEDDDIVFIDDQSVDVGEHIAEYLSLAINPYPKKTNVSAKELAYKVLDEDDVEEEPTKVNPFTVLKDLKHKT